jgi:hypothetical protein
MIPRMNDNRPERQKNEVTLMRFKDGAYAVMGGGESPQHFSSRESDRARAEADRRAGAGNTYRTEDEGE